MLDGGGEIGEGLDAEIGVSSGAALGFDEIGGSGIAGGAGCGGDGENREEYEKKGGSRHWRPAGFAEIERGRRRRRRVCDVKIEGSEFIEQGNEIGYPCTRGPRLLDYF